MISYGYELHMGFVVPLAVLQQMLQKISQDDSQWAAVPIPYIVPARDGDPRGYVAIGYTNPEGPKSNYLAYLFPMLARDTCAGARCATGDNLLVCLHPESATPLSRGLYLEEGDVKYDVLEDWSRFWEPLKQAMKEMNPATVPVGSRHLPA